MAKYTSKGLALQKSIANTFTTVAQMTSVDFPDAEVEMVETTALDSANGKEFAPTGYTDGGEAGGDGYFDPQGTTHKNLTESLTTIPSSADSWKILNTDSGPTAWPFSGWLKKFTPKGAVGEFLKFTLSIRLTGTVTYP